MAGFEWPPRMGFIDAHCDIVVEPQFDGAFDFSEGLALVCIGPCKYVKDNPKEVLSLDETWQGKFGFIDTSGKLAINPMYSAAGSFHQGLATAATGERKLLKYAPFGYIDKTGKMVIPEQFTLADDFDEAGMAAVCIGEKDAQRCGYIEKTGKYVINPQFYSTTSFKNDVAMVFETKQSTASYIDRAGKIIWKGENKPPEEKN
jgi:hypothetical protein